jgi:ketosteroid isomerase-like protein
MSEQLIRHILAAADSRDPALFVGYLSPDVSFRFGNVPAVVGHAAVAQALLALFEVVKTMRHDLVGIHACGDVWAVETVANYVDRFGRSFAFPACNLMTVREGKVCDYRIFVDNSAMFAPPSSL